MVNSVFPKNVFYRCTNYRLISRCFEFELISLPLSMQKILFRFRHQYVTVHIERITWYWFLPLSFFLLGTLCLVLDNLVPRVRVTLDRWSRVTRTLGTRLRFGKLRFPITSPFGRPLSAFRLVDRISPDA